MKNFFNKLKFVKLKDIFAVFLFLFSLPCTFFYKIFLKIKGKEIWVICEDEFEARDNGYCLFKYIREKYPEVNIYYAISKKSADYDKVKKLGNVVKYGGIEHWIKYLAASKNISSHKGGKPNAAVCYFLEIYGILRNKRVFLQHGITINSIDNWLKYSQTKMRLFVCGAYPEYEYILKAGGYPKDYVQYLGFTRFDELHNCKINKNQIVFMPTWRNWIGLPTKKSYEIENIKSFENTEYFQKCNELINNKDIIDFLEKNNLKLYFYPHRNMQKYISLFKSKSSNVIIADRNKYDIQDLIRHSALMITDYSSVSMDFAYMKKPLIYYQFDHERVMKTHITESYFSYEKDGFGPVCYNIKTLYDELVNSYNRNFEVEEKYLEKHRKFFTIYDNKNCERNFQAIKNI